MTRSTKWPKGSNQPPEWLKMPKWVWWGGRSFIVHLDEGCTGRLMLKCYPLFLDWNRIKLCKHCQDKAWNEVDE